MISQTTDIATSNNLEEHKQRWELHEDVRSLLYPFSSILVSLELLFLTSSTYDLREISFIGAAFVYVSYILVISNLLSLCIFLWYRFSSKGILSKDQEVRFCLLCVTSYFVAMFYAIVSSFIFDNRSVIFINFSFFYPLFISCLGLPHLLTLLSVFVSGLSLICAIQFEQLEIVILILLYVGLNLYASVNEYFSIKNLQNSSRSTDKSNLSEVSIGVHYSTNVLDKIIRNIKDGYESFSKVLLENECITEKEWSEDSTMASVYIGRKFCSSLYAVSAPYNIKNNDGLNFILRPSQFTFSSMLHKIFRIFECEQGSSLQLYFDDNCPDIFFKTSYEIFENFIFLLLFAIIHQKEERSVILNISTVQEKSTYRVNIVYIELDRKSESSLKQSLKNLIPSSIPLNSINTSIPKTYTDNSNDNKISKLAHNLASRFLNLKIEGSYQEQKLGLLSNCISFIIPKDIISTIDNTSSFLYSQLRVRHRWLIITSYNDRENKNIEWHSTLTPILNAMNIPTIFCDIKHLCKTSESYVVALIHESILKKYPFQFSSTVQSSALSVIVVDDTSHSIYEINQLYSIEPLTVLPSHITVDSVIKCLKLIDASQSPREQNRKSSQTDTDSLPLEGPQVNYHQESNSNKEIHRKRLSSSSQKKKISFLKLNDVFLPRLLDLVLRFEKLQIVQTNYSRKATVEAILDGIKMRLNKFEKGEMNLHIDDALFSQTDLEDNFTDLLISERLHTTKVDENSDIMNKKFDNVNLWNHSFGINEIDEIEEIPKEVSNNSSSNISFSDDLSNAETKTFDTLENKETKESNGQANDASQDDVQKSKDENNTVPKILEILDLRHKKAKFICSEYIPVIKSLRLHLQNKAFNKIEKLASMACLRSAKYSISRLSVYFATLQDFTNILLLFCDNIDSINSSSGHIFDAEVVDFILSTFDVIEGVILDVIVYDS